MEKKHRICRICNRSFANGKAMGGHMRSHFVKLPIPLKLNVPSSSSLNPSVPNSLSALNCPSSEVNHVQTYRSVNLELSSEAESPKNPTGKRSKRLRKLALNMVGSPSDSVSSVILSAVTDETLSSEDAAMCLLMLSRDHPSPKLNQNEVYYESLDYVGGGEDMDFDNENGDDLFCVTANAHPKYKCATCNKIFRSHQALGGHRASHRKKPNIRACTVEEEENCGGHGDHQIQQRRIFECPFCDKVFQSGQALGGHKKVHFSYLPVAHNKISTTSSSTVQFFDLNLPASEDDDEVSPLENSTASINGEIM